MRIWSVFLFFCLCGLAQAFPSKPITLVHGFAPGGSLDPVVRQVAAALEQEVGQPVIVEARPGATGTIAAAAVARAPADGYTLMFGVAGNLVVAPATMKEQVRYDPAVDFDAITQVARGPYVLVVSREVPVTNVAELCAYAREHPGKLNYGSSGPGSVQHFAGELLARACGTTLQHIPYKGGGQSYPALMAGDIHLLFDTMPGPKIYSQSGTIVPIAVTGDQRLDTYPDLLTFAEQGFPSVDVGFMYGIVAPAGMPRDVVATLNAALHKALLSERMRELLAQQDLRP
ncbi:MAG: Bug family tripartite tricarboxylate transporter substrate binding protein, partial [Pigmentiphaga sp.]